MKHGTNGGYSLHIKRGEKPCDLCREAHRVAIAEWRASNPEKQRRLEERYVPRYAALRTLQRTGGIPAAIADYLETFQPMTSAELVGMIESRFHAKRPSIERALSRMVKGCLVRSRERWSETVYELCQECHADAV